MLCLSPIRIRNPSFGKIASAMQYMEVPCSRCASCLSRRRNQWSLRLEEEWKVSDYSIFVTLTYSDENCDYNVHKRHVQLWLKRFRKLLSRTECSCRYFITAEYGTRTERPHYHGIIFISGPVTGSVDYSEQICKTWERGHVHVGTVSQASIAYVAKYHITHVDDKKHPYRNPTFCLMSRNPGIGYSYIAKNLKYHECDKSRFFVRRPGGTLVSLPRYYADKIYDKSDKYLHAHTSERESRIREERCKEGYNRKNKISFQSEDALEHQYVMYSEQQKQDFVRSFKLKKDKLEKL